MYTNKIGCTVYERTVGADRMEAYTRHFLPAIYWEDKRGQSVTDKSMTQSDYVLCVIPAGSLGYVPKPDDLIVCGRCTDTEPPEAGTRTVLEVKDFRYGSPGVQHIEVTAV